jgi:hypothetical protein
VQQQACQPVTKEEYCINTVDSKLLNKKKSAKKSTKIYKKIKISFPIFSAHVPTALGSAQTDSLKPGGGKAGRDFG